MAYKPKTLAVAEGGTSLTTLTAHALYVGNGTSAPTALAVGTTGQVLQGNTGADPSWGTASGALPWTEVTGTSQSAAVNNGYIANNAGLVTVTLPATFAVGDIVHVVGKGAGLWKLAANTGDTINYGSQATSASGSITATNQYDAIQVIGITANSTWACTGVSQGNLTIA